MASLYDQLTIYRTGTSLWAPLPWTLEKGDILEAQWMQVAWAQGADPLDEAQVLFQPNADPTISPARAVGMLVQKHRDSLNGFPTRILIRDGMTQLHWMFGCPSSCSYAMFAIRLYRACGCS